MARLVEGRCSAHELGIQEDVERRDGAAKGVVTANSIGTFSPSRGHAATQNRRDAREGDSDHSVHKY